MAFGMSNGGGLAAYNANKAASTITIAALPVALPLTYTGSVQTPTWVGYDSKMLTIGGVYQNQTQAGTYTAVFTPKSGYQWYDGTTTAKEVKWTIGKASALLSVTPDTLSLKVNRTGTIKATYSGDGTLSATSGSTSIATVTKSGNTFTIKGVSAGSTTITVKTSATNNCSAESKNIVITVQTALEPNLTLSENNAKLRFGMTKTITASYEGLGTLSATSSAPSIASVSVSGTTITITSIKVGTATVTVNLAESSGHYDDSATIAVNVVSFRTMTVYVDESNSDSEAALTYGDDAVGMTPGSNEWDEWFGIYPVMLLNGVEGKKLNPDDFTKHIDGSDADIASGDEGDVMVCFPRMGLTISRSGNVVAISMTDDPDDADFDYYAHARGNTRKERFYIGAYNSCLLNNRLRSLAEHGDVNTGQAPTSCRTYARANGTSDGNGSSGYDVYAFYQWVYIQAMYALKYKNLDFVSSGLSDIFMLKNVAYGTNRVMYLNGITSDGSTCTISKDPQNAGTVSISTITFNNQSRYITKVVGTSEGGFLPLAASGSATTYWCSQVMQNSSQNSSTVFNWISRGLYSINRSWAESYKQYSSLVIPRLMYL